MNGETLHTERLRLRLLDAGNETHASLYRTLYACPQVMRRIAPPLKREAADAAFGRVCSHNLRRSPGHRFWMIEERTTGTGLGLTALHRCGSCAEFGAMLVPDAWNRRIAGEAMRVVLAHAFEDLGLDRVEARSRNDADFLPIIERLLAPLGFERRSGSASDACWWDLSRIRWRPSA